MSAPTLRRSRSNAPSASDALPGATYFSATSKSCTSQQPLRLVRVTVAKAPVVYNLVRAALARIVWLVPRRAPLPTQHQ